MTDAEVSVLLDAYDKRCQERMQQFVLDVQETVSKGFARLGSRISRLEAAVDVMVASDKERAEELGLLHAANRRIG